MEIQGRTFIVTGAGSGLGRATAIELASAGARVVCLDVDAEAGEGTAAAIGDRAEFVRADVTSEADVAAAVASAGGTLAGPSTARASASQNAPSDVMGRTPSTRSRARSRST